MTTEAQPPSFLSTPAGLQIEILDQQSYHKWLGCMLSMPTVIKKRHDVDQHLQTASKAFFCHRATLCDGNVSLGKRLRYFDAVISPVAVFAAGHRTMYKTDLRNFEILFRKLLRSVVGPPAGMDWSPPWHEILHDWNGGVNEFAALHSIKLWSKRCIHTAGRIIVGGDFNACIGGVQLGDDLHSLGWWGVGRRNDRGAHLANWVAQ